MNDNAFWRGFVKAATDSGLTLQQAYGCMKYAAEAVAPVIAAAPSVPQIGNPQVPQPPAPDLKPEVKEFLVSKLLRMPPAVSPIVNS